MEILEMKNTVAEIQKSNWVSSTAKWGGGGEYGRVMEIGQWKSPSLTKRKQIKK